MEECCRFAPDTAVEGGSKEQRRLKDDRPKGGWIMARKGLKGHRNRATGGHSWSEFKRFATAIHCLGPKQTENTPITLYNKLKNYLALVLKLRYTMIFYEIG